MFQPDQGILGIACMLLLAWLCSEKRKSVSWRFVALGLFVQVVLATVLLKLPLTVGLFESINRGVAAMEKATEAGTSFVFGYLGGAPSPYAPSGIGSDIVLAFRFLPLIIVISALAALLSLPAVVHGAFDAITQGTIQGLKLFWNVVAVLLVFVALVSLNAAQTLHPSGCAPSWEAPCPIAPPPPS